MIKSQCWLETGWLFQTDLPSENVSFFLHRNHPKATNRLPNNGAVILQTSDISLIQVLGEASVLMEPLLLCEPTSSQLACVFRFENPAPKCTSEQTHRHIYPSFKIQLLLKWCVHTWHFKRPKCFLGTIPFTWFFQQDWGIVGQTSFPVFPGELGQMTWCNTLGEPRLLSYQAAFRNGCSLIWETEGVCNQVSLENRMG